MPSRKPAGNTSKPWRARVKTATGQHHLGYFDTREEAETMEREYKESLGMRIYARSKQ